MESESGFATPPEDPGWGTPGGPPESVTTYTDSAANYVPAADSEFESVGAFGGVDTTIAKKVKYEYRVRALDSQGISGDWSKVKRYVWSPQGARYLAHRPV